MADRQSSASESSTGSLVDCSCLERKSSGSRGSHAQGGSEESGDSDGAKELHFECCGLYLEELGRQEKIVDKELFEVEGNEVKVVELKLLLWELWADE